MDNYNIGLLITILSVFVVFYIVYKRFKKRLDALVTQIDSYEFVIGELKITTLEHHSSATEKEEALQKWQLEQQQVSQQLEHRIKVLQNKVNANDEKVDSFQQQQPEDKLYSRAQKMVQLGADIEEIVRECELPQAEAEILIAMHKRNTK
jgi:uncharacterized protein YlxW (UPF0749 family)